MALICCRAQVPPRPAGDLGHQLPDLVELTTQVIMDVDEVLRGGQLGGGVGPLGSGGGPVGRVARPAPVGGQPYAVVGRRPDGERGGATITDPPWRRSAATASRTAGATSEAKRFNSSASSEPRMNVLTPCSRVRASQFLDPFGDRTLQETASGGGEGAGDVEQPANGRRVAAGRLGRLVDDGVGRAQVPRSPGSRATAASRRPLGRSAVASAGCSRRARSRSDAQVVAPLGAGHVVELAGSAATPPRASVSQIARITSMASVSAVMLSLGLRRGTPMATMASQKAPAPSARSKRPPLSRSRPAAARASTAGGRSGRFTTFGASRIVSVRAATNESRVQASSSAGWSRMILKGDQVESQPLRVLRPRRPPAADRGWSGWGTSRSAAADRSRSRAEPSEHHHQGCSGSAATRSG